MHARSPGVRFAIALGACVVALLVASGAPAGAAPTPAGTVAESPARGHDYPGAPKDTRRCRKLLRQIERARDEENYDRLNKLSRRYNRTCRVK